MNTLLTLTDDRLVALYVSGNDEAFDALLARYKARLYNYIYYQVRQPDVADDIFQETFVKVIVTLRDGRYTASGRFYAFLTRVAHNLIIDRYRTERVENWVSNDEEQADYYNTSHLAASDASAKIAYDRTLDRIAALVDLLPDDQQEIVRMRIYRDLSFKEIAQQKGISINTALGRMRYAVLNMRRLAGQANITVAG